MQNKEHKDKRENGFTLVEIMIVTGIFSTLIIVISGVFIASLRVERSVLASKEVLGELSYVMEYMTRALRMAEKDVSGSCIPAGANYQLTSGGGLKFINALQESACQEFSLQGGKIKYDTGTEDIDLTSSNINILALSFEIVNETESDNLQPFMTVYLAADSVNSQALQLQTSVSQRNPDIR